MRIKGQQLYVFSGKLDNLSLVANSVDCFISLKSEAIAGVRHKGTRRFRSGKKSWSINNNSHLLSLGASDFNPAYQIGQPLSIAITVLKEDLVKAGINPTHTTTLDKEVTLVGQAMPRNLSLDGNLGGISTISIEYIGVGAIGILMHGDGFPYILPLVF